jgi:hypothetical protein
MFLAALVVFILPGGVRFRGIGTLRGPWVLAQSCVYIALGIGLLKRFQWARLATIAVEILGIALLGVALVSGLLQARLIFVIASLLRLPISALIVSYLLKSEIVRVFSRHEA